MRDLAQTTLDLVSIPSVTGQEDAICTHVLEWARGCTGAGHSRRLGNSLLMIGERRSGRPVAGLFGHLDTVLPAMDQPCEIRDGRVYGCGASDMKAGLALMMAAWEARASWDCDLVLVFYDREEGPVAESGIIGVLPHLPPLDLAVMLEPTANRLQLGCVGTMHAMLTFHGRRAHSARPWQGENAIYKSLAVLERLKARERREVIIDGLSFYEVMTATMVGTKNSLNVVPDEMKLNVNFRFAPGRDEASARAEVEALVAGEAEIEVRDLAPAGDVCRGNPLVDRWLSRVPLEMEPKQAWTDVARMTAHGVPAVNFGPGEPSQAHQAGEWVPLDALDDGYEKLVELLR